MIYHPTKLVRISTRSVHGFKLKVLAHRTVFLIFLFLCPSVELHAADSVMTTNYPTNFPSHLHWQSRIKGEAVTMDIEAGRLVAADHRIEKNGEKIDGYKAEPGYQTGWGTKFPYFIITNWKVRWGRKVLYIPRGVYTSIFTPELTGPNSAEGGGVRIFTTARDSVLVVKVPFGYDAVTGIMGFLITKKGEVHRFIIEENS